MKEIHLLITLDEVPYEMLAVVLQGEIMDIDSTEWFNDMYDRFGPKRIIQKRLVEVVRRINNAPNDWLRKEDNLRHSSLRRIFADNAPRSEGAPRMILWFAPPLRLLDVGPHDAAEDRWTKTKPAVQFKRADKVAPLPLELQLLVKVALSDG